MRREFAIESAVVVALISATLYTLVVEPGIPTSRPWIVPLAVGALVSGLLGVVLRLKDRSRRAGLFYCLAALAPNGLYAINIIMLAVGLLALTGVRIGRSAD